MTKPAPVTLPNSQDLWPDHPYSQIFPLMDAAEIQELADSIKANGQEKPAVLLEGQLLDGRNRVTACMLAKVEPRTVQFSELGYKGTPLDYVMDQNYRRRHLTQSQRAAAAAEALTFFEEEAHKRKLAAGLNNISKAPLQAEDENQDPDAVAAIWEKAKAYFDSKDGQITATELQRHLETDIGTAADILNKLSAQNPLKKKGKGKGAKTPAPAPVPPPENETPAPAPAPAPVIAGADKKGEAAELAGAAFGVSGKSVREAAKLKEQNPEAFNQVKAGEKSLNEAAVEQELDAAHLKIREVCGPQFAKAVEDGVRLKSKADVIKFGALEKDRMLELKPLLDANWTLKDALEYKVGALTKTHKLRDLLKRTDAQGGVFVLEIDGYEITVKRK